MNNQLIDQCGRHINYLRLSVTDRCDLRCKYCMPKGFRDFSEPREWLTFDEIEKTVSLFAQAGIEHLRITGGEPLVRENIDQLIQRLSIIPGIKDLSLSTNAVRLEKYAEKLIQAGVQRLNVSLDSLDEHRYAEITGGGKLSKVLNGLQQAKQLGLGPIKINCVLMKGFNEDEIDQMLEYCAKHGFTLRLIETMPIGDTGRSAQSQYMSLNIIKDKLSQKYNLIPDLMPGAGPARYFRLQGSSTKIGFITPISQHFCETCNRLRVSCEGDIFTCLGDETRYPLGQYLRAGQSDAQMLEHIHKAINLKPEKHEFKNDRQRVVRLMSMTGG
jgi:GTP 3',8-cyclase